MNAIEFDHVSKQYRLGLVSTKTLSHDIRRFWITNVLGKEDPYLKIGETNDRAHRGSSEYVWALRDIDFSVEQGDVVGIIGKNGAGKSTLLKLLSRVTGPTTGQIRAHGRIGSLLEVGTGFHSEMTGRENIYMNGAILGMTKSEIDRKLDEIVDFSGCERYIDTPVKRYSSGMMVRLGFAVAAHLEPEILVVDEVLAVGDAEFQKKAIGKMQDVAGNGRTVLFVSHNMNSIKSLCTRGVLLENGTIAFLGNVNETVEKYLSGAISGTNVVCPENNVVKCIQAKQVGKQIVLTLDYESSEVIKEPNFGYIVYDAYHAPLFGANPLKYGIREFGTPKKQGRVEIIIDNPILYDGRYQLGVWFSDGAHKFYYAERSCLSFDVEQMDTFTTEKDVGEGYISPMCTFRFE